MKSSSFTALAHESPPPLRRYTQAEIDEFLTQDTLPEEEEAFFEKLLSKHRKHNQ